MRGALFGRDRDSSGVRRRPLSTRVSLFLAAIVFIAVALVVASSGVAMRSWMIFQVDESLQESIHRVRSIDEGADPGRRNGANDAPQSADPQGEGTQQRKRGEDPQSGDEAPRDAQGRKFPKGLDGPGSSEGQLQVVERDGEVTSGVVHDFEVAPISDENLALLRALPVERHGQTVSLKGLGSFRVLVSELADGTRIIVGQPLDTVDRTTMMLVLVGAGLSIVIIAGAAFTGRRWIVREMAPLGAVAQTARRIGAKDLATDMIEPLDRVDESVAPRGTEVGDVAQALNVMIDNVASALQARAESEQRLRQFVADASHELRTPLASIQGYTQLLQRESVEPELALSRISSESARMSGLVEDLLLLARLDAGRELQSVPVDVLPLAIDAVSDAHAAGADHDWVLDVGGDVEEIPACEVLGDESAIRQVLANLVNNARVHTPAGTRVVIGVDALPVSEEDIVVGSSGARRWRDGAGAAGSVRITVADNGPGIDEALRSTVFDRFVRGDSSRTRAGTGSSGLGLSIVSSITRALGGRVEMETGRGGTTFSVYLPRLHDD